MWTTAMEGLSYCRQTRSMPWLLMFWLLAISENKVCPSVRDQHLLVRTSNYLYPFFFFKYQCLDFLKKTIGTGIFFFSLVLNTDCLHCQTMNSHDIHNVRYFSLCFMLVETHQFCPQKDCWHQDTTKTVKIFGFTLRGFEPGSSHTINTMNTIWWQCHQVH